MSRPATKRKRELEEDASRRQHIKAAGSTQDDQAALSAQEQLCPGSMIINCQYSQDHQMTSTLSTGQSQQQALALPQVHQDFNSPMAMSNGSCQRIISDREIVATCPGQLQQQLISYTTTNYDNDHETMGALAELEQTTQEEDDYSWKSIIQEERIDFFMEEQGSEYHLVMNQDALSAQEQLCTGSMMINCQYSQDPQMTTTLSTGQNQQQALALPQDHQQHFYSLTEELASGHLVMNQEEQPAQMHQDQVLLQPSCHLRNPTKEYIDVEEYFDNTTGSNTQHELHSSRSWSHDDFEQLFA